jgi:hypothetical protein
VLRTQDETARAIVLAYGVDHVLTVEGISPRCAKPSNAACQKRRPPIFPDPPTPGTKSAGPREIRSQAGTLAGSRERNKGRLGASNAVWVNGIFARLANNLRMHWRSHQPKAHHKTTTDFAATMSAEHARRTRPPRPAHRHSTPAQPDRSFVKLHCGLPVHGKGRLTVERGNCSKDL